jgi:hypothetical protein
MKRVENPDLEIRMGMERGHADVVALREHVVQQQAYPHPPVGGTQQGKDEGAADDVILDQVVLYVDRLFGTLCQQKAYSERVDAILHRIEAGLLGRLRCDHRYEQLSEVRLRSIRLEVGLVARIIVVDARAAGDDNECTTGDESSYASIHQNVTLFVRSPR